MCVTSIEALSIQQTGRSSLVEYEMAISATGEDFTAGSAIVSGVVVDSELAS